MNVIQLYNAIGEVPMKKEETEVVIIVDGVPKHIKNFYIPHDDHNYITITTGEDVYEDID